MLEEHDEAELLRLYLPYRSLMGAALRQGRSCLAGQLLLTSSVEQAAGGKLAGGAVLFATADVQAARAALRAGYCNFLVTDLNEAVRIVRNEIRRNAAVAVCLQMDAAQLTQACVDRGLQPDLIETPMAVLESRGAKLVAWKRSLEPNEILVHWTVEPGFASDLLICDQLAQESLPRDDRERRRWLRQAPSMLGRKWQQTRTVPMHADEIEQLLCRLDQKSLGKTCAVWRGRIQLWPS